MEEKKYLEIFGVNLIERAAQSRLDPVIGRTREINRLAQILSRRSKNNPIIIGEPGVGKTALVEGLAQRIFERQVPPVLQDKRIVCLDMSAVLAGTKYRGEFEKRLKQIIKEVLDAGNIIIFIDEIHIVMGAGASESTLDASNILKPPLSRGDFQCIGATTFDEYKKNIEKDGAFDRRFQKIIVDPPTPEETIRILRGIKERFEAHHLVRITDAAIETAVKLSTRYILGRHHPDKAIDVLDEAASKVCLEMTAKHSQELAAAFFLKAEIQRVKKESETSLGAGDIQRHSLCQDRIKILTNDFEAEIRRLKKEGFWTRVCVDEKAVAGALAVMTGITLGNIDENENEKILRAEHELLKRIIGQDCAVQKVIKTLCRAQAGLKDPKRPIGSFLFVGPPGVGKTFLAQELARILFGRDDSLIQLDMSEYMERHTISRLFGAPPGYVGYEEGGVLTEKVRRKPYSLVLFDEISKAHEDFTNILLQILEEGRLQDGFGRHVDFRNTIIIMTTSAGTESMTRAQSGAGFHFKSGKSDLQNQVLESIRESFRTDFLSRIDAIVLFHALEESDLLKIFQLEMEKVNIALKSKNILAEIDEDAQRHLVEQSYDVRLGARAIRKIIEEKIEDVISEMILDKEMVPGQTILVSMKDNELEFETLVTEKL